MIGQARSASNQCAAFLNAWSIRTFQLTISKREACQKLPPRFRNLRLKNAEAYSRTLASSRKVSAIRAKKTLNQTTWTLSLILSGHRLSSKAPRSLSMRAGFLKLNLKPKVANRFSSSHSYIERRLHRFFAAQSKSKSRIALHSIARRTASRRRKSQRVSTFLTLSFAKMTMYQRVKTLKSQAQAPKTLVFSLFS